MPFTPGEPLHNTDDFTLMGSIVKEATMHYKMRLRAFGDEFHVCRVRYGSITFGSAYN